MVFFPPGTYLVSTTIPLPFGAQVIGDVLNRPLIIASSGFIGLGVLSTDEYTSGGTGTDGLDQEYFVNTANFYRQIRNVIIDVRNAPPTEIAACLHCQVAQATSLQNVELRAGPGSKGVATVVADSSGTVHLSGAGQSLIDQWMQGPVYSGSAEASARSFSTGGKIGRYRRQGGLVDQNSRYFERPKPQYEGRAVGDFLHVKDFGATGDGQTDDSDALQRAIYASQGKILFVDAGSYILTKTVVVPAGVKIVGETWSQLVASGLAFSDATAPMVMLKVGATPGQVGNVEMQDLTFTAKGPTAGAVLVEWNMAADAKGSAAL